MKRKLNDTLDNEIEIKKESVTKTSKKKIESVINEEIFDKLPFGEIVVFGCNDLGQLGLENDFETVVEPQKLVIPGERKDCFVQVECGGVHSAVLTKAGTVYTWGCNDEGALGRDTSGEDFPEHLPFPVHFPEKEKIIFLSCGDDHSAFLTSKGSVYFSGAFRGNNGIFRSKEFDTKWALRKVYDSPNDPVIYLTCGSSHIVMLTKTMSVITFGAFEQGQLGRVSRRQAKTFGGRAGLKFFDTPSEVVSLRSQRKTSAVKMVSCGAYTSFAFTETGKVYGWGSNHSSCMSLKFESYQSLHFIPTRLPKIEQILFPENENIVIHSYSFCCGVEHTLFLRNEKLYACGQGIEGNLGNGDSITQADSPIEVKSAHFETDPPVFVTCGDHVSFVITKSGKLFSWGSHCNNQLGYSSENVQSVPKLVVGSTITNDDKVLQVSAGGQHTLAILAPKNSSQ